VSYTWAKLTGNYDGLFSTQADGTTQFDPNSNATFDLKSFLVNGDGFLNSDIRSTIKAFASKEFLFGGSQGISVGLGYTGHSGTPTSYIGYDAIYQQALVYVAQRGTGQRTPWVNELDGHIGYNFRMSKDNMLSVSLDIFNVANWDTATATEQRLTATPTPAVTPITAGGSGPHGSGTAADVQPCFDKSFSDPACKVRTLGLPGDPARALTDAEINHNFGKPTVFQEPRVVRLGARFTF